MLSEHKLGMQPESQERRMMRRFDMRLPAVVRVIQDRVIQDRVAQDREPQDRLPQDRPPEDRDSEFQTETQNVSARGVFFYLDRLILAGTFCLVTFTFPHHITLTYAV